MKNIFLYEISKQNHGCEKKFFACLSSDTQQKLKSVKPNTAQLAGRVFFAGYLASKNKKQVLGKRKREAILDDEFCTSAWIDRINFGGLSYPKKELVTGQKISEANYFVLISSKKKTEILTKTALGGRAELDK